MRPATIEITLPSLHDGQRGIKQSRARFNVVAWGRRGGKTTLGQDLCCEPDILTKPTGWFAPSYKDMIEVWRTMTNTLEPITQRASASERRIENIAGGVLEFWSLDNVNAGRGRKYARVIVDECAFVPHLLDAWNYSIRPTLVDLHGDAYFFSTPKGRNGFWQLWTLGDSDEEWAHWQMPTSVNPTIPQEEIEAMRRSLPERVFGQEILAEFLEDAGGVFRGVMAAATATEQEAGDRSHQYIAGVDWALSVDFTVCAVVDVTTRELVFLDRYNGVDYSMQRQRIKAVCDRFGVGVVIAEANAMGKPNNDELRRLGLPVRDFTTTNATKADIIETLAAAFEQGNIRIINDPVLISELQAYEVERTPSGMTKYSAPEGMHDDTVMSLALAWHGAAGPSPAGLVSFA